MFWFKKIEKKEIYKYGIGGGILQILYILMVAWFINSMDKAESQSDPIINIMSVLLLFVFSATISGFFVLGYPAYLALQKRLQEAFLTLLVTILTLLAGGVVIFSFVILNQ
ncbi:hypothetical protein JW977_03905 [Candidatus Falkowbacteria bacterium]|nr:hypothetical protein [Candidatus Falkowbacteria bacterium]